MGFIIILLISIGIGIWKFPFIDFNIRKSMSGTVGCGNGRCDCNYCAFVIISSILAIITVPLMLLWLKVLKPAWEKAKQWQEDRTDAYRSKHRNRDMY